MNKQPTLSRLLAAIGLSAFAAAGIAAATAAPHQDAATAPANTTLAELAIRNYAQIKTRLGTNTIVADLAGPHLLIVSPQYEMTAPKIHLEIAKGGTPARYKATEALATGGVHIVARNPAAHQTTTLTCDRATYHATTAPKDRGSIALEGHVRSETTDPALVGPLVQQSERGTITFTNADTTDIELENGNASGKMIEPASKPKTPGKKVSDRTTAPATTAPKDRIRIALEGHLHSETTAPMLVGPLVQEAERGTLTFDDAGYPDVELDNSGDKGEITATPIEPKRPVKPAGKSPAKKATP